MWAVRALDYSNLNAKRVGRRWIDISTFLFYDLWTSDANAPHLTVLGLTVSVNGE